MEKTVNTKYSFSRSGMEEAAHRNSWFLCPSKFIATIGYIQGVRKGEIFCLKYEDVRKKSLWSPPPAQELLDELRKVASLKKVNLGIPEN